MDFKRLMHSFGAVLLSPRTVAGVFDVDTGLRLVKFRGEAMQEAAEASPQKMISVAGLSQEVLEKLCKECRSGPDDVCQARPCV